MKVGDQLQVELPVPLPPLEEDTWAKILAVMTVELEENKP